MNIQEKIRDLQISPNGKEKILNIYNKIGNFEFSSSTISEILSCSRTQAYNYIQILIKNNLIKAVKGNGKGKYKFITYSD